MGSFRFWILLLMVCVAATAAIFDLRQRRIPNALTVPAMLAGIVIHTARSGWGGFTFSLLGLAIGGGALLLFFVFGGMGAGDVKLLAGIGALGGLSFTLSVLVLTGVAGGIMAIGKLIVWHRRPSTAVKDVKPSEFPADSKIGDSPLKETMPYGVAIAIGTLASVIMVIVNGGSS
ncbi:MAG: A24 family peptidase [Candidatus Eisenbacteria bacterium]